MSKKIILFDVDGTIAESGQIIDQKIKDLIKKLNNYYDIGIVGGGKMNKILLQLEDLTFDHYFFECGCVYYKKNINNKNNNLEEIYSKNIRNHPLYEKINILVKTTLEYLSKVDYTLTGNFIDLRTGMIYISLIGMYANNKERLEFIELDKKFEYRKKLLQILVNKAKEIGINDKVSIYEGGTVGLAIFPIENDKTQVLDHLNSYTEIHYFGDKYKENGNDHNLINHEKVKGYRIDNLENTKNILQKMLK